MFERVDEARFIEGEHEVLGWWSERGIFAKLLAKNAGGPKWSFLDGPITANNPMGVHHAWGRTYKDAFQRYRAMTGHELRYQNGFDCQGLWVEVEVEKEMGLGTKTAIAEHGIDKFVQACKKRVLTFAARQTEQSQRLGYWMEWDDPDQLRKLAAAMGQESSVQSPVSSVDESGVRGQESEGGRSTLNPQPSTTYITARGQQVTGTAEEITAKLGNPEWGGSYFTFSTENNETIWAFLKKCFERGKIYLGHDVMPWGGRAGSAYSQMEIADGRKLTTHRSCFVRFPLLASGGRQSPDGVESPDGLSAEEQSTHRGTDVPRSPREYLLVWTTTPWTLTSNVAAAVNPDLEYVRVKAQIRGDEEPAFYYFAKENLDFKRLEREFKEGFGRPEWQWPDGLGKLKSIAQIFKEQGGYEVVGTVKGAEMVGWRYAGPFDDLEAQQLPGGYPSLASGGRQSPDEGVSAGEMDPEQSSAHRGADAPRSPSGIECHRVIDGGRDFKGNPHVVAGEGTGIVHIAPGCGDVDHQIGRELGLVSIAPLKEDGTFGEGFGPFTGRQAIDPDTATLVFDELKRKGLLVYVEEYPHVYPHCWRTGEELIFRLVDEWFINMDWRDEIKEVTRAIEWLPASINGQERELEWLTTMRDWMISKKRFWGLALPIWVNPDDPSDFKVVGSLAELEELATNGGEGWEQFEGHTPHRPWIDVVKIPSDKHDGQLLQRVEDVGNPWLDAGITPFSTMNYRAWKEAGTQGSGARGQESATLDAQRSTLNWNEWYPADFVTECFPGQFRNWFYSLLALSTMMRYDECDTAEEKRPFKTLFGYRLVMDEAGQPMHKSDGTAIWFEEAAEQLGVDTLRWLYLAQNPAVDLRFGTRHPDEPVTLNTPEGPISQTKEGLPTVKVTSKPADDVRRQVLIPLWNSYAFFVNYAVADEFDPTLDPVPLAERPEIDRWILSRLQELTGVAHEAFQAYDVAMFMTAAATYIDDLSNWYIRRNRRRFWRSRGESSVQSPVSSVGAEETGRSTLDTRPTWDTDKLAAYQTLHEVLLTLSKLLAPCIPFLAERMYQNLARGGGAAPRGGPRPPLAGVRASVRLPRSGRNETRPCAQSTDRTCADAGAAGTSIAGRRHAACPPTTGRVAICDERCDAGGGPRAVG